MTFSRRALTCVYTTDVGIDFGEGAERGRFVSGSGLGGRTLAELRDGPPAPFPFEGELAYIEACIGQAPALQRAWEAVQDRWDFVWCYEVAEPFGLAYGRHLLQGGGPDAAAGLLHDLVGDALLPPSA